MFCSGACFCPLSSLPSTQFWDYRLTGDRQPRSSLVPRTLVKKWPEDNGKLECQLVTHTASAILPPAQKYTWWTEGSHPSPQDTTRTWRLAQGLACSGPADAAVLVRWPEHWRVTPHTVQHAGPSSLRTPPFPHHPEPSARSHGAGGCVHKPSAVLCPWPIRPVLPAHHCYSPELQLTGVRDWLCTLA